MSFKIRVKKITEECYYEADESSVEEAEKVAITLAVQGKLNFIPVENYTNGKNEQFQVHLIKN